MHIKEFRERKMALIVRRCLRKSAHAAVAVALFTAVFAAAPQFSSCASDKAVETVYLGTPAHVWWETDTTGKWSSVSKAHEYQVKLYIADGVDRDEDNWRKVDFDDEGMKEAECVMTKRTGETSCDFSAYMDDLHTYFFVVRATPKVSEQGYRLTGWQERDGNRYYLGENGQLATGWFVWNDNWYYSDKTGVMQTGWVMTEPGKYYYMDESGVWVE